MEIIKILEKAVVSKIAPCNTSVGWLDVSGDIKKLKIFYDGDWITVGDVSDNLVEIEELLAKKVDKEEGKELSSNDFTDDYKNKLDNIEQGAQANQNAFTIVNANGVTKVPALLASDTLTLNNGYGISITADADKRSVTIAANDEVYQFTNAATISNEIYRTLVNCVNTGIPIAVLNTNRTYLLQYVEATSTTFTGRSFRNGSNYYEITIPAALNADGTHSVTSGFKNIGTTTIAENNTKYPTSDAVKKAINQVSTTITELSGTVTNNKTEIDNSITTINNSISDLNDKIKELETGDIDLTDYEKIENKLTTEKGSIDENSTDTQYPTAKVVYEAIKNFKPDTSTSEATYAKICTVAEYEALTSRDDNTIYFIREK